MPAKPSTQSVLDAVHDLHAQEQVGALMLRVRALVEQSAQESADKSAGRSCKTCRRVSALPQDRRNTD